MIKPLPNDDILFSYKTETWILLQGLGIEMRSLGSLFGYYSSQVCLEEGLKKA